MKRNFAIGSEWLYYKIYTGVKITDTILIEKLYPIIEELKANNLIEKWFFIRYRDTDEHLRLRFYSPKKENLFQVIQYLYPVIEKLMAEDIIWKVQLDTYQRELERYGSATMETSESIFYYDSEMIVAYLALKPFFLEEETELLFSFLAIDSFLNVFSLPNKQKLDLLDKLQISFKKEFNATKILKKEFDKNYRSLSARIEAFINNQDDEFSDVYQIINHKERNLKNLFSKETFQLEMDLNSFLSSHIHMTINRQFSSRQRHYECLIYDHLYRYYKSVNYQK